MKTIKLIAWIIIIGIILLGLYLFFRQNSEPDEETVMTTEPVPQPLGIDAGAYPDTFADSEFENDLEYYLYIPEDAKENMPLVVYLHGIGSVGALRLVEENPAIANSKEIFGDYFPYFILAPNSKIESWIGGSMPQRVKNLIDHIVDTFNIDPERIIITGHSMGSTGVLEMVSLYGDYFSAAVPISEPYIEAYDPGAFVDVPLWSFAGSEEAECNQAMQRFTDEINALGGNARHVELEDYKHGKTAYGAFEEELFYWMISQ